MELQSSLLGSERERIAPHCEAVHAVIEGLDVRHARLAPEPEVPTNWPLNGAAWSCIARLTPIVC